MSSQHYQKLKMLGLVSGSLLLSQGIFGADFAFNRTAVFAETPDPKPAQCEGVDCPRSELDPNTPHIISPRLSVILSDRPLLRWYAVEGETRYIVRIKRPNHSPWEQETTETFVVYDGPPLIRGQQYLVEVSTYDGEHEDETSFIWLTEETEQEINAAIAGLSPNLSPLEKVLAIVEIYEKKMLFNDAIDLLEAHLEEFGATAGIYDELVRLYGQIGLKNKVEFYQEQNNNLE